MNPFVFEICQYVANNTSLTLGTSLMVGEVTRGSEGVYAVTAGGNEPDRYTGTQYHIIDFWAKYKKTNVAHGIMKELYDLLHRNHHYTTTSYTVFYSNALSQVMDMDRDAEENKLLKISFNFIIE